MPDGTLVFFEGAPTFGTFADGTTPACSVPPRPLLAPGVAAMTLPAAAALSFSAPAPFLPLLSLFASASSLLRAWAPALASAPPLLFVLVIMSICMRGLDLILSKVDRRTS